MQKLFYYLLIDEETYGIKTEEDIAAISKEKNAPVWVQVLANYTDVENSVCEGNSLPTGHYIVSDGIIWADDEGLDLISNLRIVA